MKKILKLVFIIIIIILVKLVLSFIINELIINNYNNKVYNSNLVKVLYLFNYNEPYIVYYNNGNILYQKKKYDKAITKYNEAISKKPPQKRICDIRINLSIAMVKNIKSNDYNTVYNELEKAKNNLYNNKCANSIDDNGYSKEAEQLEKEIRQLQENLGSNTDPNPDKPDPDEPSDPKEDPEIENKLGEIEKRGRANREKDLPNYDGNESYYTGKKW